MSRHSADLDSLLTEIVAEAWAAGTTAAIEDQGWRSPGSQQQPDRRTLNDLDLARRRSRWLLEGSNWDDGNEFAIGAATNRVNYAVGENGLKYEAVPAPGVPDGSPLVAEAQQFIDIFCELNDLPSMERESVWRGDRDGEAFIRLFGEEGVPEARFVEPERVVPPALSTWPEGMACEWGIVHPKRDRGTVHGAYIDSGDGPQFVPEAEFVHLKFNTTSEYVRGWPTWEPVRRSLVRAEELLVAMTATGKARAKIALISEIPGWSANQADQLKKRLTERHQEQPNGDLPRRETVEELPYGSHFRVREGTKVTLPSSNLGAADMIEAIQANLRAAAQRTNMPEWMFSGMADQKYSNAFVVEAPSLREFRALQKKVTGGFGDGRFGRRASLIWRAMRMAAVNGLLNPGVLRAVRIKCTAPSLEVRDKSAEATTNVAYINAGVKPVPLVQQELGIDPAEMVKLKQKFPTDTPPAPAAPTGANPPAAPAGAADPLAGIAGEHFGVTDDGREWVSEELARWLGEAWSSAGKTLTTITDKNGNRVKRWVKDGTATGAAQHTQPGGVVGPDHVVSRALRDPSTLTPADVTALATHAAGLDREQLRQLNLAFGQRIGGAKVKLAQRLLEHVRARKIASAPPAPVSPPPPPPPPPPRTATPGAVDANLFSVQTRQQLAQVAAGDAAPEGVRDQLAGRLAALNNSDLINNLAAGYGIRAGTFARKSVQTRAALVAAAAVSHAAGRAVPQGAVPAAPARAAARVPAQPSAAAPAPNAAAVQHTFTEPGAVALPSDPPRTPTGVRFQGGEAGARQRLTRFFGRDTDTALFAAAVNAHDGATVTVTDHWDGSGINIETRGNGYYASRSLSKDPDTGAVSIKNNYFRVDFSRNASPPPDWIQSNRAISGSALLANQVRAARALGVAKLKTHAARANDPNPNRGMNGYYTWPRLGYDDSIPGTLMTKLQREQPDLHRLVTSNPTGSTKPNSVLGLMSTEAGRKWWKTNGSDLYNMEFDLRADSLSMRTAAAYAGERAGGS